MIIIAHYSCDRRPIIKDRHGREVHRAYTNNPRILVAGLRCFTGMESQVQVKASMSSSSLSCSGWVLSSYVFGSLDNVSGTRLSFPGMYCTSSLYCDRYIEEWINYGFIFATSAVRKVFWLTMLDVAW